jgi:hypothetical protein
MTVSEVTMANAMTMTAIVSSKIVKPDGRRSEGTEVRFIVAPV